MGEIDLVYVVLLGFSTGFGASMGAELSRALLGRLKGLKLVKKTVGSGAT
jgi:hypothetical protein